MGERRKDSQEQRDRQVEAETYKGKRKTQRHRDNTLEIQMHIETRAVRERIREAER